MILGIDLSTTVCGLAICFNNKIIEAIALDISIREDYDGKAEIIINQIDEWLLKYNNEITAINLEGALNSFAFGKTNAMTLIKLIKCSAVISYILSKKYNNLKINSINMNSARKQLFRKSRIKGIKSKEFVKIMLEQRNPECINFYIANKTEKKKTENKLNEDIRDAMVMALYINNE